MRTIVAVAAALYLLAFTMAQCGILFAHDHGGKDVHISSSSSTSAEEQSPGHAHIDDGSKHVAHDGHTVVAMPRSDNPLRPLTVTAIVAMALAVVLVLVSAPRTPRAPPDRPDPVRRGRTVLNELCINRC